MNTRGENSFSLMNILGYLTKIINAYDKRSLCTRESLYYYYRSSFTKRIPHYRKIFNEWAYRFSLRYKNLRIAIDETNWKDDVTASITDKDCYLITIPKGLFERFAYLTNLLARTKKNEVCTIFELEIAWKDPDKSFYDFVEDCPDTFMPDSFLRPLLHDYKNDCELYEEEFNRHWSKSWPKREILNKHSTKHFFWIIDFIVYHEMSHILLRHFDKYQKAKDDSSIIESVFCADELFIDRHLIELHADIQAATMQACSINEFKAALNGKALNKTTKSAMFNLSYFTAALFTCWAKYRTSQKMHKNLPHPHPDIRRMIYITSVSQLLHHGGDVYAAEWLQQCVDSMYALQGSFTELGAMGLGDSVFNNSPCVPPETLKAWQQKTLDRVKFYEEKLIEFSRYMKDFDRLYHYFRKD
jgi:hypothetical protein